MCRHFFLSLDKCYRNTIAVQLLLLQLNLWGGKNTKKKRHKNIYTTCYTNKKKHAHHAYTTYKHTAKHTENYLLGRKCYKITVCLLHIYRPDRFHLFLPTAFNAIYLLLFISIIFSIFLFILFTTIITTTTFMSFCFYILFTESRGLYTTFAMLFSTLKNLTIWSMRANIAWHW